MRFLTLFKVRPVKSKWLTRVEDMQGLLMKNFKPYFQALGMAGCFLCGMEVFDATFTGNISNIQPLSLLFMNVMLSHSLFTRMRQIYPHYEITQVDLVLNWREFNNDHISRHVRITNRLGQQEIVSIAKI
mmetsp:Transcript_7407/g.12509  ORF Transcript_7407/g.12509 Transcript_7407/m.12509 type:complete len:130 (+) Transcript_7407:631-1020(+)